MHSEADHVKKSVRTYIMIGAALFVFTAITVAVNQVHLAVPFAITVALIIAATKGSMVASVFMHLSHEKKWIYGALLLTVIFFAVLMFVPLFTVLDGIGTMSDTARAAEQAAHAGH
jgi:caa(3)-type oxidase subunit IV